MADATEVHPEHSIVFRKLRSISPLHEDEKRCLSILPLSTKSFDPDQVIVREGDRPSECCLVIEGFTCRHKYTAEGKRQIFSFPHCRRHSRPAEPSPQGHGSQSYDAHAV